MDTRTGRIYSDVTEDEARERGLRPIPPSQFARVCAMPIPERIAWAASQDREERRRARNKRKAARKGR